MYDLEYQQGGWLPKDITSGELIAVNGLCRSAPKWVVKGWTDALQIRGLLPKVVETPTPTATEL